VNSDSFFSSLEAYPGLFKLSVLPFPPPTFPKFSGLPPASLDTASVFDLVLFSLSWLVVIFPADGLKAFPS